MIKKWFLAIAFVVIFTQPTLSVMASGHRSSSPVGIAIRKYKIGNYTGCLQDMQSIVRRDPSNAVAYYYIAMSYSKAGRKDKAIEAYSKVLSLRPNATLANYAETGKRCLSTPDKCKETDTSTEQDKMIAAPYGDGLSSKVRADIHQKRLEMIKNEINTDKDIDSYQFRQFNDYTHKRSEADVTDKVAVQSDVVVSRPEKQQASDNVVAPSKAAKQPTNDEIVAALRVLSQAGLNPYAQAPTAQIANGQIVPAIPAVNAQADEMAQLSMMMNSQSGNNNNSAMNMLPYLLSQSKNGGSSYSPQLMQAMMMNSMLPNLDFSNKDDDK